MKKGRKKNEIKHWKFEAYKWSKKKRWTFLSSFFLFSLSINIDLIILKFAFKNLVTCHDRRAEVEYMNGTVKNCLYWPCTVGYFCEYNESQNGGQYICCGTNANNIYGLFYQNLLKKTVSFFWWRIRCSIVFNIMMPLGWWNHTSK